MALHTQFRFFKQLSGQIHLNHAMRGVHAATFCVQRHCFSKAAQSHPSMRNTKSSGLTQGTVAQGTHRHISSGTTQTEFRLEPSGLQLESFHARDIYKEAVNSVEPRQMVENVLLYDSAKSVLTVQDKSYQLDRNVYVVGFGKAVLGMARAVEDVLGEHVVQGILSIPRNQRQILQDKDKGDLLLVPDSRIKVHEGGSQGMPDEEAHRAALEIEQLLVDRKETDLVIVLISGGGSPLLPCPQEPITLDDLVTMTKMLAHNGAPIRDINTIRKKLERLKGGKMVDTAYPAKVVSLIISDVIGDHLSMIASGPTVPDQVPAHQCFEILTRFGVYNKLPASIHTYLNKQMAEENSRVHYKPRPTSSLGDSSRNGQISASDIVQNVLVGSNSIACQAAFNRARELGHLPYVLTTEMEGSARDVGAMLAKLGMFMLMCFDRKLTSHLSVLRLELDIVGYGITKQQINEMITLVSTAANMGCNIVIISGGQTVVNVEGSGIGGRNMEVALGAGIVLQKLFDLSQPRSSPDITLLSADTDGEDGPGSIASGAVINENFDIEAQLAGFSCQDYLDNNDSYTLFKSVKGGSHLVVTKMTGTNVMDIQILVVRNPLCLAK